MLFDVYPHITERIRNQFELFGRIGVPNFALPRSYDLGLASRKGPRPSNRSRMTLQRTRVGKPRSADAPAAPRTLALGSLRKSCGKSEFPQRVCLLAVCLPAVFLRQHELLRQNDVIVRTNHASAVYLTLDVAPRALKPRALLSHPVWDYFLDIAIHRLR